MKYDVVIAGGGPAGSTCAEILAKGGLDVILLEKGNNHRYKTCAGGLMWHNELDFGSLPAEIIERNVEHLFLAGPTKSVDLTTIGTSGKVGQLTYRNHFDYYLRELASKSGARIETNSEVTNVTVSKSGVEVEIKSNEHIQSMNAEALVLATGAQKTQLQQRLHMDRPADFEQAIIAEFSLPEQIIDERFGGGAYDLYFNSQIAPHGYLWIFTKREGLSVGMCDKNVSIHHFEDILAHHPILSKKLENSKPLEFDGRHIWAAPIPDRIPEYIYRDRVLLVGDAAGLSDRFTYEGIWHARYSGKAAAETLIKAKKQSDYSGNFLQKYQMKCSKLFNTVLSSQRMHHLVYHSGYMDLIIDTMAEILQDAYLGKAIISKIQILLEGFLEPGNEVASLGLQLQQKLLEVLREKVDRTTIRKLNREIEFALALS